MEGRSPAKLSNTCVVFLLLPPPTGQGQAPVNLNGLQTWTERLILTGRILFFCLFMFVEHEEDKLRELFPRDLHPRNLTFAVGATSWRIGPVEIPPVRDVGHR